MFEAVIQAPSLRGWRAATRFVVLVGCASCTTAQPAPVRDLSPTEPTSSPPPDAPTTTPPGPAPSEPAPSASTRLDAFIAAEMDASHRPGLSLAVIKGGAPIILRGYGVADVTTGAPVTPDTLFMVASVSKPVVATAILQLMERGLFRLDDDNGKSLPFPVRNPNHPTAPITYRMVLTHTSTIVNNYEKLPYSFVPSVGTPLPKLQFVLENFVVPGGAYYDAEKNFLTAAPGQSFEYSGLASAFSALLVEELSGLPFEEYCRKNVFTPLGMTRSAWHLADVDRTELAVPHAWRGGANVPIAPYELSAYPAATLRTSASELARFLLAFMQDGALGPARVLSQETVAEMRRPQIPSLEPSQGLIWYTVERGGSTLIGHSGYFDGYRAEMFYRPEDQLGMVLLSNGEEETDHDPLIAIEKKILELASEL